MLPSEAAKQPGPVIVTNAAGALIATIDPLTRRRRSLTGRVESILTPQGFNAYLPLRGIHPPVSIPPRRPPQPDYGSRLKDDRDPRR
ncbi:MAG: hypothetical protein HW395_32 [candidate division NC10 bacterium]|nr:hypothetical protein [candidate division NC10 bacterium]